MFAKCPCCGKEFPLNPKYTKEIGFQKENLYQWHIMYTTSCPGCDAELFIKMMMTADNMTIEDRDSNKICKVSN